MNRLFLLALLCLSGAACTDHPLTNAKPDPCIGCYPRPYPTSLIRDVDLLFVVDNSGSMADEQSLLSKAFPELMTELRLTQGGLPNVHVGVTSTDLGTGMFTITYCENVGGDQGNLLKGTCQNPAGVNYIIDVEPTSCEITRQADRTCSDHNCSASHCSHESTTSLVVDPLTGCPRCRNYHEESLEEVFACLSLLGTSGCGFEQPLESMYKALDNNPQNAGFLREANELVPKRVDPALAEKSAANWTIMSEHLASIATNDSADVDVGLQACAKTFSDIIELETSLFKQLHKA